MKKNENGRSMVEMLGVLAIIGVLSAGALAGYNKAMQKHKINQLISDLEMIIEGLWQYKDTLESYSADLTQVFLANEIQSLNLMPATWSKKNDNAFLDSFQNTLTFFIRENRLVIDYYIGKGKENFCSDLLLNFAKPNAHALYSIWPYPVGTTVFGDDSCTDNEVCIRDMTASDIHKVCSDCSAIECIMVFNFSHY